MVHGFGCLATELSRFLVLGRRRDNFQFLNNRGVIFLLLVREATQRRTNRPKSGHTNPSFKRLTAPPKTHLHGLLILRAQHTGRTQLETVRTETECKHRNTLLTNVEPKITNKTSEAPIHGSKLNNVKRERFQEREREREARRELKRSPPRGAMFTRIAEIGRAHV